MSEIITGLPDKWFNAGCIKFGKFKLKMHEKNPDAPLSPIYINFRILRSYPDLLYECSQALIEITKHLSFDLIGDVPTSATPLATLISYILKKPLISPRKEAKTTGTLSQIDGVFSPNQTVLLIDDLITKAESKVEARDKLISNELVVHDIAVLVDREQGGINELKKQAINTYYLFTISELMQIYVSARKITNSQYEEVMNYIF